MGTRVFSFVGANQRHGGAIGISAHSSRVDLSTDAFQIRGINTDKDVPRGDSEGEDSDESDSGSDDSEV